MLHCRNLSNDIIYFSIFKILSIYLLISVFDTTDTSNKTLVPPLLIKENNHCQSIDYFPNVYHILQCLTTKSAHSSFDLERYEMIGDCFLKLMVVMSIYTQFTNTNEGNMANLKSQRVSNKYLFKLAKEKYLHQYITTETFQPKINWILPNEKTPDTLNQTKEEKFKFKVSDKTLADTIEALIGMSYTW